MPPDTIIAQADTVPVAPMTPTQIHDLVDAAQRVAQQRFVSVADAAAFLGIAKSTAYAAARTGSLCDGVPVRKVRRRFLVASVDLRRIAGVTEGELDVVTP